MSPYLALTFERILALTALIRVSTESLAPCALTLLDPIPSRALNRFEALSPYLDSRVELEPLPYRPLHG